MVTTKIHGHVEVAIERAHLDDRYFRVDRHRSQGNSPESNCLARFTPTASSKYKGNSQ
jgi:hypothetical protein